VFWINKFNKDSCWVSIFSLDLSFISCLFLSFRVHFSQLIRERANSTRESKGLKTLKRAPTGYLQLWARCQLWSDRYFSEATSYFSIHQLEEHSNRSWETRHTLYIDISSRLTWPRTCPLYQVIFFWMVLLLLLQFWKTKKITLRCLPKLINCIY